MISGALHLAALQARHATDDKSIRCLLYPAAQGRQQGRRGRQAVALLIPQAGGICEAYLLVRPQCRQQSQRRQQVRVLPEGHLLEKLPAQGQRPANKRTRDTVGKSSGTKRYLW